MRAIIQESDYTTAYDILAVFHEVSLAFLIEVLTVISRAYTLLLTIRPPTLALYQQFMSASLGAVFFI